jgi:GMC oxidoreductase
MRVMLMVAEMRVVRCSGYPEERMAVAEGLIEEGRCSSHPLRAGLGLGAGQGQGWGWEPDANGPVAKVEFPRGQRTARTIANREFMARKAGELLRGAGATKVVRMDWAPLILHVQSTMRMGTSQSDSVLDSNAKSLFVDGLYVADNSALANALGGPNPTLTCQALATRTPQAIFVNEFGGSPWVNGGTPVVSTDPRITAALPPELK